MVVAVWGNYEDLNLTIEKETDELNTALIHSSLLPDSLRMPLETTMKAYCLNVVNTEWKQLNNGSFRQSALSNLRVLFLRAQANTKETGVLALLDDQLSTISNLRRERLSHNRSYVPHLVWTIVIISSIMVVVFSFFLYMENEWLKKIFLSFLWAMMGMSLFLIYMLDHPFEGSTQVSKVPYEKIIQLLS
ncbi:MAG: DUF4239 domain-containing protein [Williamsia sp.]|nr:DUF4239 domain-containing protein [Williamsia sp.]